MARFGIILILLTGCTFPTEEEQKQRYRDKLYSNQICLDGVVYIYDTHRFSVKFNKNSKVELCDE